MHADSRAGDGALRLGRRARRGPHRARLDRGARSRRRQDRRHRADRRSHLRQAELRQGALGARRAEDSNIHSAKDLEGKTIATELVRATQGVLREAGREREGRVLVGRDRGEAADAGRCDRRSDRDRLVAAREPPAHRRHADGVEHAAHRQQDRAGRRLEAEEARRTSRCCSRPPSKRRDASG